MIFKMNLTFYTIFILSLIISTTHSYKILGIFPHFGKSHFDIFSPIMKKLAEIGHEVTVISYMPQNPPVKNYKDIVMNLSKREMQTTDVIGFSDLANIHFQKYSEVFLLDYMAQESCNTGLYSPEVLKLLKTKQKFDLIIIEAFNTDCFLGFVHKFKAPFIQLSSSGILPWFHERFALPNNPSYIPSILFGASDQMSFGERAENVVLNLFHNWMYRFFQIKSHNEVKDVFGEDLPDFADIARNASLFMANTHFTLNRPKPLVPAYIDISGVHIKEKKQLPKNLEKWINESKDGVIYFSMGSMIKGHTFPEDKRQAFLRAFGRLGQRVLWKWENDTMPGKPDNVMIQKWMPQFDILCHPNVKAFISHGGLLGTTEAVHCGVPVVVMPQFGDQHTNARALEASGGGVVLNFKDVTEDSVYNALKTVLDPKFNKQAKELSDRFRDRPMPPMETAIYWIEYVARHKGAHHMRTAAVGMPFYQYLLLDVIAFLAAIVLTTLYIIYKVFKFVISKVCGGKKKKVKKN